MKILISVLMIIAVTQVCLAGTLSNGTSQHKLSNKETCFAGVCATSLRLSHKTTLEATLTADELEEFGPNTRIQGNFPLGPTISFKLSEDPNYVNGDTSIKIVKVSVFNNVTWKHIISMRWDNGLLKLSAKVSAKQQLSNFYGIAWDGIPKTKSSFQSSGEGVLSVTADNIGTTFLSMSMRVLSSVFTKNASQSTSKGQTKITSSEKTKITPLPEL